MQVNSNTSTSSLLGMAEQKKVKNQASRRRKLSQESGAVQQNSLNIFHVDKIAGKRLPPHDKTSKIINPTQVTNVVTKRGRGRPRLVPSNRSKVTTKHLSKPNAI